MLQIQYSKQKQELRGDPVLDGLLYAKEFIRKNFNSLIGVVVTIVLCTGIFLVINYIHKSRIKAAREEFGKAMILYGEQKLTEAVDQFRMIAENNRRSVVGTKSAYMLGSILQMQGRYDEAITWYKAATQGPKVGFINLQAYEGLAACYEFKADTAAALMNLERALADDHASYRRNAIRWKIALLTRWRDMARTKKICDEIIADTAAQEYRQDAEFLKATLIAKTSG